MDTSLADYLNNATGTTTDPSTVTPTGGDTGAVGGLSLSGLAATLASLGGTAGSLYSSVSNQPAATTTTPAAATTATTASLIKSLPWIIGGGILLILGVLFFGRRK
jgi:hypothetical protein